VGIQIDFAFELPPLLSGGLKAWNAGAR